MLTSVPADLCPFKTRYIFGEFADFLTGATVGIRPYADF